MESVSSAEQQFLKKLIDIIDANLHNEQFGVNELAEELGMSRATLHRKVKSLIKKSVTEFIRETRLKRANELLHQKVGTVSEIAYKVGFGSVTYFTKCFHDYYGYPPGETSNRNPEVNETGNDKTKKPANSKKRDITIVISVFVIIILAVVLIVLLKPFPEQQKVLKKTIAVLPFRNDSPDSTNAHINGLMESILTDLSNIEGLDVRSRTSVENYRGSNKSLKEIARELKVSYIIEGSGQKFGNEILIKIQLLEAKTDRHLLSKEYRKEINEVKDFIELQSEIAYDIVSKIESRISPKEKEKIEELPTKNLQAYNCYLRGNEYLRLDNSLIAVQNLDESNLTRLKAKKQFEHALALDSTFAEPYILLGNMYIHQLALFTFDVELADAYLDSGLVMAEKALLLTEKKTGEINERSLWPNNLKAYYFLKKGMTDKSREYFNKVDDFQNKKDLDYTIYHNRAVRFGYFEDYYEGLKNMLMYMELKPEDINTPSYILAGLRETFKITGYPHLSEKYTDEALQTNNDSIAYLCNLSEIQKSQGDFVSSESLLLNAYKVDSANIWSLFYLMENYVFQKNYKKAFYYLQKWEKVKKESLEYAPFNHIIGFVWLQNEHQKEAKSILTQTENYWLKQIELKTLDAQLFYAHLSLAAIYSSLNKKEKALEYLLMIKKRKTISLAWIIMLKESPIFDNIRLDPEFANILTDFGAKYQKEHERIKKLLIGKGLEPA